MKTNAELQKDVQEAIQWEPSLSAAEIGVIAHEGVVTLTGTVDNYSKKWEAEHAAKSVSGVQAVVEKIEVSYGNWGEISEGDIAIAVVNALKAIGGIPNDWIRVVVENGWVTLEGDIPRSYLKGAAHQVVGRLAGVRGLTNNLVIRPQTHEEIEQRDIERALSRNVSIKAEEIRVEVSGTRVILTGRVHSWYQKEEAERIAWNTPGVVNVDNALTIDYDHSLVG